MKNFLAGEPRDVFYNTVPSDKVISRLTCHQYPPGGGWLEEHDPVSSFARIQTLVQASDFGRDFSSGGIYYKINPDADDVKDPDTKPRGVPNTSTRSGA